MAQKYPEPPEFEIGETLRVRQVEDIAKLWERDLMFTSTWMGVVAAKNPCDAWVYQELLWKIRPEFILETGSFKGGGALMLATMMDMWDAPHEHKVVSIDITNYNKPNHPRIVWLNGSSVQEDIVAKVHEMAKGKRGLVILDSDHDAPHVLQEMEAYADLVQKDSYMIVEDTWVRAHAEFEKAGPWPAVETFIDVHHEFEIDDHQTRYLMTNNPKGFLRRL